MNNERPPEKMKQAIRNVFWLYVAIFAAVIGYLSYFYIFLSGEIISDPHNPRLSINDNETKRGSIYDANMNEIAVSGYNGESYIREYKYGKAASHLIGYVDRGKAGLEAVYNFDMQKLHNEPLQRIMQYVRGAELTGNSLCLTLNMDIQNSAYERLGKNKGAVVVMEPHTGKILAMVSYPNFNPNEIRDVWSDLNSTEDAPLLNRAAQGLYTPGSVFKIMTAAAIIENDAEYKNYKYECTGSHTFSDKTIHCFNGKEHGIVDLSDAMAYSCNTFFSERIHALGAGTLSASAEKRLFNGDIRYPLPNNKSVFALTESPTDSEIVETAIGQGRTLVTPIHIAMITAAVSNNGIMMRPYVVDYALTYNNRQVSKNLPKMLAEAFTDSESTEILEMMRAAVLKGTGSAANIEGVYVAGKTGTAENPNGTSHSWFTAYAEKNEKKVVITVVLENPEGAITAAPVAADILKGIYN